MTATVAEAAPAAPQRARRPPWPAALGLTALVLATRLPNLDRPRVLVFDELYYALDAADLLRHGVERAAAHPPLGKWMIAGGIRAFGFTPLGWRSAAVLAGVALVLVTWLTARRLTDDTRLATAAGVLVALDGIAFVTGRLALLDGFVAVTTTAAAGCLLAALRDRGDPARLRRWRWAVAVLVGVGAAVKWSALWSWPVIAVVLVALEARLAPPGRPRRRTVASAVAVLTLVPAVLYVGAYGVWFAQAERTRTGQAHCSPDEHPCHLGLVERLEVFVDHQRDLVDFHANLDPGNPYVAPAWTWAIQSEPADLFDKPCRLEMAAPPPGLDDHVCPHAADETRARLLVVANPVSWVAGLVALVALAVAVVRRRDDRSGVLLALVAAQWVPWMLTGREVYSYYAVTLVPLLALAVVIALDDHRRARRWVLAPLLVGSAAAFVWLYPLLVGEALSPGAAGARLLLPGWSS